MTGACTVTSPNSFTNKANIHTILQYVPLGHFVTEMIMFCGKAPQVAENNKCHFKSPIRNLDANFVQPSIYR